MPTTEEDRREQVGRTEAWHHELGWISKERREWGWSEDDEAQAQLDMDTAEVGLWD
jgi:hypothetical protein